MSSLAEAQRSRVVSAISCRSCKRPYPDREFPYRCPACGGLFGLRLPLEYRPSPAADHGRRGVGRYRSAFPIASRAPIVTLGEGGTPLAALELEGREIYLKCEHLNPTGSFKDRGSCVLVSALHAEGVAQAVEDSSGNAGASFAAYSARAGIKARVFLPDYASGPKRSQIEAYGAEVVRILGPRSRTSEAVERAAVEGSIYASHAYLPHGLAGMATLAFEVYEQLGRLPGALVAPAGQGTLLLGAYYGFQAIASENKGLDLPRLLGVQAQACAPLWAVQAGGSSQLMWTQEGETIAEGIRIVQPLRGDEVLGAVEDSGGWFETVAEQEIRKGLQALAKRGFFVEPTSAVVWPALGAALERLPDPVVVVLTGSGLKSPSAFREAG